jgi:predicted AAA+ superfamily ATPase
MYTFDFEEFLWALDKTIWSEEIRNSYFSLSPTPIHEQLINLYRTYLCIGGMPEAISNYLKVKEDILSWNKKILSNIIIAYLADMNKYVFNNQEAVKIEKTYKSIPIILSRKNNKFKYSEINKNANKRTFESSINWLTSSNMICRCDNITKVEPPLKAFIDENKFKLYLNDVGLLTSLLDMNLSDILLDRNFMLKGVIAENYVVQALTSNSIPLYYWSSGNNAEIDFLLYNNDGIIPIEVKAGTSIQSKSLNVYMSKYNPQYGIRISGKNFGFENNIKSIPLYAVFCI